MPCIGSSVQRRTTYKNSSQNSEKTKYRLIKRSQI